MTADQYRTAISRLNLNQREAAELLGVSLRESQRWACGERPVPRAVELVLRLSRKELDKLLKRGD